MISLVRPGRGLIAPLMILAAAGLTGAVATAQNLDAGKSAEKLFADGCTTCHRSPRGLAKGRMSLTLSWFLADHYAASSDSAKALAAYLQSVDEPPPRAATKPGAKPSKSAPRPPKPATSR